MCLCVTIAICNNLLCIKMLENSRCISWYKTPNKIIIVLSCLV